MWGKTKKPLTRSKIKIDSYIGKDTLVEGNITFSGGMHIQGTVRGALASEDADSILILSEDGYIEGNVHIPYLILDGKIKGQVTSTQRVELTKNARIFGDLHYRFIEMSAGAEVNGTLIHFNEQPQPLLQNIEEEQDSETDSKQPHEDSNNAVTLEMTQKDNTLSKQPQKTQKNTGTFQTTTS